jgi:heme/copper-type cytochrome/quinol oxidase subunit 2
MQKILLIEYHRNLSTGFIIEPHLLIAQFSWRRIMKAWKTSGLIVLLVWIAIAAIIWFRNVDGAGVAQTAQLKEITLLIWLIFAIPVIIGYLI